MSDSWDTMRKAKEGEYFERKNSEALERLKKKQTTERLSPITGKPMEQVVMHGVVIDRCPESGGIWLDAGELEELTKALNEKDSGNAVQNFFHSLLGQS